MTWCLPGRPRRKLARLSSLGTNENGACRGPGDQPVSAWRRCDPTTHPGFVRALLQLGLSLAFVHAHRERRHTVLIYPAFVARNLLDRIAQHKGMVEPEAGHARDERTRDNVGRVVCPADADLEDGEADAKREKDVEREQGEEAKVDGVWGNGRVRETRRGEGDGRGVGAAQDV